MKCPGVGLVIGGGISAVGYYFAKALHQELDVPIGLIDTSTPATGIECWMSQGEAEEVFGEALSARPGRFIAGMGDPACYYNGNALKSCEDDKIEAYVPQAERTGRMKKQGRFSHEDFIEGMDYVGAASFLPVAQTSDVCLFI